MNIEIYDKELLLDFAEDCLVGFNTPRLGKLRVITLLKRLRLATIAVDKSG